MKLAAGAISTVLIAAAAWANWNDTSTGIDLTKLPAFPLTKVRAGDLQDGAQVRFDGLLARTIGRAGEVREASLQGTAKSGKAWSVRFSEVAFGQLYRGDLDGNGTQDYIVFGRSGANGRLAPPWNMIVLLMDKQGLPVPFEAFLYDDLGPRHVVDLLHNGRAQLIDSVYDEDPWDIGAPPFCSGRWITNLYEPADLNWGKVRGVTTGITFPFVRRWTYGPTCDPQSQRTSAGEAVEIEPDATALRDLTAQRILSVDPNSWSRGVKLTPSSDCDSISIGIVVYDRRSRREITLRSNSGYGHELLGRIQTERADVALRGVYNSGDRFCRAGLLWASK
jgi:hypothetical protein